MQLSTNLVDTLESMVWIKNEMFWLNCTLTVSIVNVTSNETTVVAPGQKALVPAPDLRYRISSEDGNVQLEYFPVGVLPQASKNPLVYGGFYHSYGVYTGRIVVTHQDGEKKSVLNMAKHVVGVFEDHSASW